MCVCVHVFTSSKQKCAIKSKGIKDYKRRNLPQSGPGRVSPLCLRSEGDVTSGCDWALAQPLCACAPLVQHRGEPERPRKLAPKCHSALFWPLKALYNNGLTFTHSYTHSPMHTPSHIHTHIHPHIYPCIHTFTHSYTQTFTHSYSQLVGRSQGEGVLLRDTSTLS